MAEETKLLLKQNDILVRYADEVKQFKIFHAVNDRVEIYSTKTKKGAAIVTECLITGNAVPKYGLTDREPNTKE